MNSATDSLLSSFQSSGRTANSPFLQYISRRAHIRTEVARASHPHIMGRPATNSQVREKSDRQKLYHLGVLEPCFPFPECKTTAPFRQPSNIRQTQDFPPAAWLPRLRRKHGLRTPHRCEVAWASLRKLRACPERNQRDRLAHDVQAGRLRYFDYSPSPEELH